ncbi:hypothetical protein B0H66DRAFT_595702 [Apodospora peruviana]|uniref:Nephrocystin 3-like N-terminal domain-containing protein n=1 Tax=Apodospora peruviana TaxID=516989 RepID=A0AAE0HSF1_9PEZI|nr:hypothetical protein B0H66DRAFT_595702 [Apodospora peruviana]
MNRHANYHGSLITCWWEVRRRKELLDAPSTHDYMIPFKQARRRRFQNTGLWFTSTPAILSCRRWQDSLEYERGQSTSMPLFYHIRFDNADSLQAETILRSIARQNLFPESMSDEPHTFLVVAEREMFSHDSLHKVLERKLVESKAEAAYIVIDGLDELTLSQERSPTTALRRLMKHPGIVVKLLLSCRDSKASELRKRFPGSIDLSLHSDAAKDDLKYYITQVVEERRATGDLVVSDPTLVAEISDVLIKGAQGMFLWVALEIEDVCFQCSDAAIRAVLQDLPRDLTETFDRALKRILIRGRRTKDVARRVFQILSGTKRVLGLSELREAASVVFIHHTVKKFILTSHSSSTAGTELAQFHFNLEEVDHNLGEICVTYLELNDFKTTVSKRLKPLPPLDPGMIATTALKSRWKRHTAEKLGALVAPVSSQGRVPATTVNSRLESLARLEEFRDHVTTGGARGRPDQGSNENEAPQTTEREIGPFLDYAGTYWLEHTTLFSSKRTHHTCWSSWRDMITGSHHLATTPWTAADLHSGDQSVITWADDHVHVALLHCLLLGDLDSRSACSIYPAQRSLALFVSKSEYHDLCTQLRAHFQHERFVQLYGQALSKGLITGLTDAIVDQNLICGCKYSSERNWNRNSILADLCDAARFGIQDWHRLTQLTLLAGGWHGHVPTLRAHRNVKDTARTTHEDKTALHLAA